MVTAGSGSLGDTTWTWDWSQQHNSGDLCYSISLDLILIEANQNTVLFHHGAPGIPSNTGVLAFRKAKINGNFPTEWAQVLWHSCEIEIQLGSWEVLVAYRGWARLPPSFPLFPLKAFPQIPAKRSPV